MENICAEHGKQVFQLPGEPAVIINGVPAPNVDPNVTASSPLDASEDTESKKDPGFGKAMVGREVRKMFGKQYYLGKVVKFDEKMNWYRVVYEDGDKEDLEWHELEEVVLPLDINIPVKQLAGKAFKLDKSMSESGDDTSKSRRGCPKSQGSKAKAIELQRKPPKGEVDKGNSAKSSSPEGVKCEEGNGRVKKTAEAQTQIKAEHTVVGVKSGKKRGRPRKTTEAKNQIQGGRISAVEVQNQMQSGRKRGRPRKTPKTENQEEMIVENNQVEENAISEHGYHRQTETTSVENIAFEVNPLPVSQVQIHTLGGIPYEEKATSEYGHQTPTENIPGGKVPAETNVCFESQKHTLVEKIIPVEANLEVGLQIQTEISIVESISVESNALSKEKSLTPRAVSTPFEAGASSETAHQLQMENTTVQDLLQTHTLGGIPFEAKDTAECGHQNQTENIPGRSIPAERNDCFESQKHTLVEEIIPLEASLELGHQIRSGNSTVESIPVESNALPKEQSLTLRAMSIEARVSSEIVPQPQTENSIVESSPAEGKAHPES